MEEIRLTTWDLPNKELPSTVSLGDRVVDLATESKLLGSLDTICGFDSEHVEVTNLQPRVI